jgi:hypothetical protein
MIAYPDALQRLLEDVKGVGRVRVIDYQHKGEWFQIKSLILSESDLFDRMEKSWRLLTSQNANRFALLYVTGGQDRGIWIHYFPTAQAEAEYAPGCHRIPSW